MMIDNDDGQDTVDLPPEDRMGFAVPKTPTHSPMLLNSYMRTDMLQHIHAHPYKMKDNDGPGSPLHHTAKSLEQALGTWGGINLFECFTRNPFHIDPGHGFRPEQDYLHDIKLMKHHLKCLRKTIKEIGPWR